jgi:hypothetical protein
LKALFLNKENQMLVFSTHVPMDRCRYAIYIVRLRENW